ncbi:hypothetical protein XELAEV_18031320mg [Xenopus laevis]|uniref:Uncharacterized protein n=1 Tax=Xenopus laevis TaxID=8355 RepID=A0A974CMV9_XENLA|nr:hypothetical protein XELAEV_18031320mg [Xenopus laevis]
MFPLCCVLYTKILCGKKLFSTYSNSQKHTGSIDLGSVKLKIKVMFFNILSDKGFGNYHIPTVFAIVLYVEAIYIL